MDPKTAITQLTQSEKIKAGLIWFSHAAGAYSGLPEHQKQGAAAALRAFVGMLLHEVHLVRRTTGDEDWSAVERHVDMALVMVDSGVAGEASFHLTRALGRTTAKAEEAMGALEAWGLY